MLHTELTKDIEKIIKTYGEGVEIDVRDTYYKCSFKTKIGSFDFLLSFGKTDKPFALKFDDGFEEDRYKKVTKAIKKLQEI